MLSGLNCHAIGLVISFSLIKGIYSHPSTTSHTNSALQSYPSVLYVWTGQDAAVKNASDFVAVIDFNEKSLTYGSILRVIRLVSDPARGIGQASNEPHHSSISSNGKYYITGGLLSFLSKQKEIFVWKIPRDKKDGPIFKCAINAPGACTDEFHPIGDSKFLVSMMCNESGDSPGDMAIIDGDTCTARSMLKNVSTLKNFNPHGFDRLNNGSILVADYVAPITLTNTNPSQIVFQSTCRHFFPDGSLKQTFKFEYPTQPGKTTGLGHGIGFMELKTIPKDKFSRGFACGTNTNTLYLFGPGMPEPLAVYDVSEVNGYIKRPSAGIVSIFPDGKRMIMTFQMRFVILVDITQPERPKFLRTFDFCTDKSISKMPIRVPGTNVTTTFPEFCAKNHNNTGTHVVIRPNGENRFIVFNYFLKFGLAQFAGTRSVHAFKLNKDLTDFTYDQRFNPNCEFHQICYDHRQTFDSLQGYPHHAQYLRL
ncbi:uncharacterized protein LOC119070731 [Bradysia coprophila]|uniref:uncharacterized protein LOC119070731 n=1 Tax=Bradysia coprophila TaxID=38358 RepID=UPI00187D98C3|nr:uncharacterized protein LOC119070731 [Bradysia coprophila]XP_037031194.1 uncharacterized protein LOC119070731 [Bradysia coprophila]